MKRYILILGLLFIPIILLAGDWKDVNKFKEYKAHKLVSKQAEATGNLDVAITNYIKCIDLAREYATPEILVWCLNNTAYLLIKKHQSMKGNDTELLKQALEYLTEAQKLGIEGALPKIQNNIDYCEYWLTEAEKGMATKVEKDKLY
jgi:hypothetical protein